MFLKMNVSVYSSKLCCLNIFFVYKIRYLQQEFSKIYFSHEMFPVHLPPSKSTTSERVGRVERISKRFHGAVAAAFERI